MTPESILLTALSVIMAVAGYLIRRELSAKDADILKLDKDIENLRNIVNDEKTKTAVAIQSLNDEKAKIIVLQQSYAVILSTNIKLEAELKGLNKELDSVASIKRKD